MLISVILLLFVNAAFWQPGANPQVAASRARLAERSVLTGVYRIDIPASDTLYSVVAGASSNVPFNEQQRFFIDLAVRLTPPDLLAIERQNTKISLGSSRAPRMTFVADGVSRNTRASDGHLVRARFSIETGSASERLVFTSSGRVEDNFSVVFESLENGKRLRVVRQISAEALDRPLVIKTIYNKISDSARWELYSESQVAASTTSPPSPTIGSAPEVAPAGAASAANVLRKSLNDWVDATNSRDIDMQLSFYAPRLKAYYLTRNTPRAFVREEKARVFAKATLIDIRAAEPEIIFLDAGRVAIMRYRKKYRVENGRQSRRGEVIQELRWQRVGEEWRIFSERDIKVL